MGDATAVLYSNNQLQPPLPQGVTTGRQAVVYSVYCVAEL